MRTVDSDRMERMTIGVGFLVAVGLGIAGSMAEAVTARTALYAVSSVGWVMATSVLVARRMRAGDHLVAAGFLILTLAEGLLWVNGRPGGSDYVDGFGGGTMLYVPGLVLVAMASTYSRSLRALAVAAAVAWATGAVRFVNGSGFADTDGLATVGYVLISAFFVAVAIVEFRRPVAAPAASAVSAGAAR